MITVVHHDVSMETGGRLSPQAEHRFFFPKKTPPRLDDTLRIALIADWHVGPYKQDDYIQRVVDHLTMLQPDLVVMPGDFAYTTPEETRYLQPLSDVTDTIPVYASLGNHDFHWREQYDQADVNTLEDTFRYAERTTAMLKSFGIEVLRDRNEYIEINGQKIQLSGQDDWWATERDDVDTFVSGKEQSDLSILMQHNPDGAFSQEIPEHIDLVVSGHTHGGQIRLPFIGSVWTIPTELGNEIDQGWFPLDDPTQMVYITHGIGETGPRARLLAWPEVVVFDIKQME